MNRANRAWRRLKSLIALAGLCAACAHASPAVQAYGRCASGAAVVQAEAIVADVTTALATGNYETLLAGLAVQFGAAEVGCAVDLAISEFRAKAERTADTQIQVVLAHGEDWRREHP